MTHSLTHTHNENCPIPCCRVGTIPDPREAATAKPGDLSALEQAKSYMHEAHEILRLYGRNADAEQVLAIIDSLAWAIKDLEEYHGY